jgi:hypothetical protein
MTHDNFCTDDYPIYLTPSDGLVSFSEEQCLLMQLCYRLASTCNFADESPNDVDEMRKQAQLLMNLMHSNCKTHVSSDVDMRSSLERSTSDQSFTSYRSTHSTKKRGRFSCTCPSLSLENVSSLHDLEREVSGMQTQSTESHRLPQPAHLLLGRSLKVDDPDALRLSADAMARNVLQSFQQAMHWRIHAWIYVLSKKIVLYEHQMLASGATLEDLKALLQTPEAKLIVALQKLAHDRRLAAESVITSFEVLPQRIENYEDQEDAHGRTRLTSDTTQSMNSSSASSITTSSSDEVTSLSSDHGATDTMGSHSSETYSYVVAHELRFSCTVHLQTLVGFTEIAIMVPGTVAGWFESSEVDPTAQFKSVKVDVDTNVLASLIDKACRAVVRSSVEQVITQPAETASSNELGAECGNPVTAVHDSMDVGNPSTPEVSSFTLTSPPPPASSTNSIPAADNRSAFVTPGPNHCEDMYHTGTPSNVLIPIPDDLKGGQTETNHDSPRRISPQPTSSRRDYVRTGSTNSSDGSWSAQNDVIGTRSTSLKRRTSTPRTLNDDEDGSSISGAEPSKSLRTTTTTASSAGNTNVQFLRQRRSVPLISPPGGYSSQNTIQFFHSVAPNNGPSLPMLVEAACQVADLK